MNTPLVRNLRKTSTQSTVAFLTSSCLHLLIIIPLALVAMEAHGVGVLGLHASISGLSTENGALDEYELASNSETAEISSDVDRPVEFESSISSLTSTNDVAIPEMNLAPANASSNSASQSLLSDIASGSSGGGGGGGDGVGRAAGKGPKGPSTSFFGIQAHGNRFVYVIDSSKSMVGERWTALCRELIRGIQSLSPDQEFYVISFDYAAHPMFGMLPPRGTFLTPEKKNVEKLQNWIRGIIHGGATLPASSVGIAIRMKPDAIFLLSDGEIKDSTVEDLRIYNRFEDKEGEMRVLIPIHTVLLDSDVGYEALKTIADENDGTFTPIILGNRQ